MSTKIIYLLDDGNLWTFHEDEDGVRIHANMVDMFGKQAVSSAKRAFEWIFTHTDYSVIYARIPIDNRPACFIARQCMTFIKKDERHHYEVRK